MTKEQYIMSIKSNQLQLSSWNKLSHFSVCWFLLSIPLLFLTFHVFDFISGNTTTIKDGELLIIIIPTILGALFYFIQKKRLSFEVIESKLEINEICKLLLAIGTESKWSNMHNDSKMFNAKTNPPFFSGSWGEQITVLFFENKVFVNSICDLDRRPSVVSFGRNRENENLILTHIQKASVAFKALKSTDQH